MSNKKKEVYKVKPLTEGKKNIITALLEEYDSMTLRQLRTSKMPLRSYSEGPSSR